MVGGGEASGSRGLFAEGWGISEEIYTTDRHRAAIDLTKW